MERSIIILFIFCWFIGFAQQQKGSIEGSITSINNEPLFGATVALKDNAKGVLTDENGNYRVAGIVQGDYTVIIAYLGYKTVTKNLTIKQGQSIKLNVNLKESIQNLEEVVVKGKSKKQKIETSGFAVNALEMQEIKLQSIQPSEILDQSAGVRLRQSGGMGSRINYNINGLSGNSIRIFIDGIPIRNYGPSFSLTTLPASMIKRIEVYKGVVPAFLGGDALGGAINVVLNESAKNNLNASYSFGSFNTHQTSLNGRYRHKKTGFTIEGSAYYNKTDNSYKVWGNEVYITDIETGEITYVTAKRFHDNYAAKGIKLDAGFTDLSWADKISIGIVVSDMAKDIQHGATMETVYGTRKSEYKSKVVNAVYKQQDFLVKNLRADLFASYSDITRKAIDTIPLKYNWLGELTPDFWDVTEGEWLEHMSGAEGNSPTLGQNFEDTYSGRARLAYTIGKNHTIDANFSANDFKRNSYDPLLSADIRNLQDTRFLKKKTLGLSYSINTFNGKLKTSVFYKYYLQKVGVEDPQLSSSQPEPIINRYNKSVTDDGYGFTLSYQVFPSLLLMTSAESAIRLPQSNELFGNDIENTNENHTLRSESSLNVNFGVNLGPFSIKKHELSLNTNFFRRDVNDKIKQQVTTDQTAETTMYVNLESVLSTGFDSEFKYSYNNKLFVVVGGSIFNSRFNMEFNEDGEPFQWYKDRERNAPYFTLNANTRYNINQFNNDKASIALRYNIGYVHEFFRDWESLGGSGKDVIPTQLVNDFGVSYTMPSKKTTLSFDAKNILNAQVFDNYALQRPGRAFYIKINYNLF